MNIHDYQGGNTVYKSIKIFANAAGSRLANDIAARLSVPKGNHTLKHFSDEELLVPRLKTILGSDDFVVAAPDVGAGARARKYNQLLEGKRNLVYFDKDRPEPNKIGTVEIIGRVRGYRVVIVDDMADTGGTAAAAAKAAMEAGATDVTVAATHGILSGKAITTIDESPIERLILSDTIASVWEKAKLFQNTEVVIESCAGLLADAIRRTHDGESVSSLII